MIHNYSYEVRIEDRDEDGNVTGSYCEFETNDRERAIEKAREIREKYNDVVIEIYDQDNDNDFVDTIMETDY